MQELSKEQLEELDREWPIKDLIDMAKTFDISYTGDKKSIITRLHRAGLISPMPVASVYDKAEADLLSRYPKVKLLKYRAGITGISRRTGIEAPKPRSELSFAVFAHEIAHQVLGHTKITGKEKDIPRWREELEAWNFALEQLRHYGFSVSKRVKYHMNYALAYALASALNRGMKKPPPEMTKYMRFLKRHPLYVGQVVEGYRYRVDTTLLKQ